MYIFEKRKQLFGRIFTNWKDEAVNVKIPDTSVSLDVCLSVCLSVSLSVSLVSVWVLFSLLNCRKGLEKGDINAKLQTAIELHICQRVLQITVYTGIL